MRSRATLNLPIWYEEGFASYLSTLSIDPTGVVTVGRIPYAYLRGVFLLPGLSIPDVIGERFRLDPRRHDLSDVYGLAWAIVRFLHHAQDDKGERYASRLGDMLAAIDNGASSEEALESSLGLDTEDLKGRLKNYYDGDQLPVFRFRIQTQDRLAFRRDCLDPIDTRKHLAEVAATHHPRFAIELYDSILARKPDDVDAWSAYRESQPGAAGRNLPIGPIVLIRRIPPPSSEWPRSRSSPARRTARTAGTRWPKRSVSIPRH